MRPEAGAATKTVVLLRATEVDARLVEFGRSLARASGASVAYLLDERQGPVDAGTETKISLTNQACGELGLFRPKNLGWKCGDYGLYLARRRFPEAAFFWMIESDVRFAGGEPSDFFRFFAGREEVDFLGADVRVAEPWWFWFHTARSRDVRPQRCFFPVTRTSARAIDVLLEKRVEQSRRWFRRALWPNDEAFVATTLASRPSMRLADFNDFGPRFYDVESYGFMTPMRGEEVDLDTADLQMLHPVLYGDAYARKLEKIRRGGPEYPGHYRVRRVAGRLCQMAAW